MKKLYNIIVVFLHPVCLLKRSLAVLLCVMVLSACQQYSIGSIGKKQTRPETEYIQADELKQILKPIERQNIPVQNEYEPPQIKIALLAPLSGKYKNLGQSLLDAAQLAIFRSGNKYIILAPYDTKDSPVAAVSAARRAADDGARIILGPVFSASAKAVANIAIEKDIQVVSFSNDKSLSGSGVFAIGLLPEQQIRRVMEYSVSKGIKKFITVLPGDAYGSAVAEELKQFTAMNPGISVIRNEIYQVDGSGRPLKIDDHMKAAISAAMSAAPDADSPPIGVLMPASAPTTLQMVSSLSLVNYNKDKVRFIGGDQWGDTSVLKNPIMDGAFFTASPAERRIDFENKFKNVYGYEPPKLAGFAYDGIALVATIARISGNGVFNKDELTSARGFIGVDGIFRLQYNGLAERGFAVMGIENGRARVIDQAPTSFSEF